MQLKFNFLLYLGFMKTKPIFSALSILLFVSTACNKDKCESKFFGIPVSNTGLDNSICTPICECEGIASKSFSVDELLLMKQYTNTDPSEEILENPYDDPVPEKPESVCAVVIEDKNAKTYHLETFSSREAAKNAGAIVTHTDACGACSGLQDLSVYAENLDVGADVRACAISNLAKPMDSLVACIQALGFTRPCAQIWAFNTKNTQAECFEVCINNNTYNNEDGSLSECLQCDETNSGPVFKAVAGRTRRNTGIANAICRFCEEVEIIEHNYSL